MNREKPIKKLEETHINESPLLAFRQNVYSQNGEDGILREIFARIGVDDRRAWCVEFGAWDGKHLSNTFHFVESSGWQAIYIESDASRFEDLLRTASSFRSIHPHLATVSSEKPGGLDEILTSTPLPREYDLLSIDIDSFDLAVWANHLKYQPRVVVIEINSSIVPGILQWHLDGLFQGNSFSSTVAVAKDKGYELVCHTGNLIFVRNDLASLVNLPDNFLKQPERMYLRFMPAEGTSQEVNSSQGKKLLDLLYVFSRQILGQRIFNRLRSSVLKSNLSGKTRIE